jgi:ribulose-bisphosphate carboxylase large chain|tara:strand:- start:129 stop:338 length:210 start_codon:yes stop_codon:yes gene_type:complete
MSDRIVATYWIETPNDVEAAADVVGGEQSSGTFVQVPGETADLKERFRARTESVKLLESVDSPRQRGTL